MALKRVRVPVRFSTGKSIPLGGGSGTTVEQVSQTIVNQSGGLVSSTTNPTAIITWPNVLFVPPSILSPPIPQPTDDPDDALIIPGPIGLTGKSGANAPIIWPDDPDDALIIPGPIGLTGKSGANAPIIWPDDPDDAISIPGPAGAAGAAGAAGQPGASGMSLPIILQPEDSDDPLPPIPGPAGAAGTAGAAGNAGNNAPIMWPDDIEDPLQIPGPAGAAGAPGSAGATGATGPYGPPIIFEVQDPDDYVAIPGPQGLQGIQGVPGASGSGGGNASMASWLDWEYPEEIAWRDIPQNCDVNVWSAPQIFQPGGGTPITINAPGTANAIIVNASDNANAIIVNDISGTVTDSVTALLCQNGGVNIGWVGGGASSFTGANKADFGINCLTGTLRLGYGSAGVTAVSVGSTGTVTVAAAASGNTLVVAGELLMTDGNGGATTFAVNPTEAASLVVQAWGPTAGALVDMTPDTGTFTITYTGMTTSITGTAIWARIGNLVTLFFPAATGTSNGTSMTATGMPAAIKPARAQAIPIPSFSLETGGTIPLTDANDISIATSGTVTFYLNGSATGFGGSVTKGVATAFTVSYLLN